MSQEKQPITLPADVYDALEFTAEVFGGVGAYLAWCPSPDGEHQDPCCLRGLSWFLGGTIGVVDKALNAAFPGGYVSGPNDTAVYAINRRKGITPLAARVPFQEFAAELGLVREEAPTA